MIETHERHFKGIWIPEHIWLRDDIGIMEKVLWAEIDSLSKSHEGCFASNEYFAEFFKISGKRIEALLKNLRDKNLIKTISKDKRNRKMIALSDVTREGLEPSYLRDENPQKQGIESNRNSPGHITSIYNKEYNVTNPKSPTAPLSQHASRLAVLFFDLIQKSDQHAKKPNMDKWAKELDKINRIDKRPWDEIENLITFAQSDDFWKSNILSPQKLRKQASQLFMKMNKDATPQKKKATRFEENMQIAYNLWNDLPYNTVALRPQGVIVGLNSEMETKISFDEHGFVEQVKSALRKFRGV